MSGPIDKSAEAQEARAHAFACLLEEESDRLREDPDTLRGELAGARRIARLCAGIEVYAKVPASDPSALAHLLRAAASLRNSWIDANRERRGEKTVEERDAVTVLRLWRADP